MDLETTIKRIKEIMNQLFGEVSIDSLKDYKDTIKINNNYNPEVEKLQKLLKSKGYYIGNSGNQGDGIDGVLGKLTKAAHEAYLKNIPPTDFNPNSKKVDKDSQLKTKNIIIGDSQTPYVDMNTKKASRISTKPGKSSLWEGGKTVDWLISALRDFEKSPNVKNVIIVIGTNGGFGKFLNDDIPTLVKLLKEKFPTANFYAVKGSWGWGGLKNIKEKDVNDYYKKFENYGVTIIKTPIGNVEPHSNLPVYAKIGEEIDELLN